MRNEFGEHDVRFRYTCPSCGHVDEGIFTLAHPRDEDGDRIVEVCVSWPPELEAAKRATQLRAVSPSHRAMSLAALIPIVAQDSVVIFHGVNALAGDVRDTAQRHGLRVSVAEAE